MESGSNTQGSNAGATGAQVRSATRILENWSPKAQAAEDGRNSVVPVADRPADAQYAGPKKTVARSAS